MKKPCDKCETNIQQAIVTEEITCYRTCKQWLKWSEKQSLKGVER